MPADESHTHPCAICGARVPCDGELIENFDGWPGVVCELYHLNGGRVVMVLCDDCGGWLDAAAE